MTGDVLEPAPPAPEPFPRTSQMMRALLEQTTADPVPVIALAAGLKNRALGLLMLLFAVPCIVPMPPGLPVLCAAVLLACGLHLVLGRETLWLPRRLAERGIARGVLEKVLSRTVPIAERVERLCRPRWQWITARSGRAVIGAVVVLLALVLMLPIPFLGNLPPGVATAIMAIGLLERDGLVIALGLVASAVALVVTSALAWAAIEGLGLIV